MSDTRTGPRPAAPAQRGRPSLLPLALVVDVAFVVLFAAIGRSSHDESGTVVATLGTAWPFLVGLAVGWLALLALAGSGTAALRPLAPVPSGVIVWIATVAGGMILRAAVGSGTAFSFILVASLFTLLTLVGWRVVALLVGRLRGR